MERDIDTFIHKLCQTGTDKGMFIENRKPHKVFESSNLQASDLLRRLKGEHIPRMNQPRRIQFLLIITPGNSSKELYGPVKRCCDELGYASQCVDGLKMRRQGTSMAYLTNLLLKVNVKLGGINVSLTEPPSVLKTPTVHLIITKG
jgi:hypothetical protein